jgi:hypothetical protein
MPEIDFLSDALKLAEISKLPKAAPEIDFEIWVNLEVGIHERHLGVLNKWNQM